MATVTTRKLGTGVAAMGRHVNMMENTLDCDTTNVTNGDTVQVLSLAAKTVVLGIGMEVITVEGGTLTVDVGDGDDPNGYLSGANGNAAAGHETSFDNSTAYAGGRLYTAADTIDVLFNNAADAAVLRFWALVIDVGIMNSKSYS